MKKLQSVKLENIKMKVVDSFLVLKKMMGFCLKQ